MEQKFKKLNMIKKINKLKSVVVIYIFGLITLISINSCEDSVITECTSNISVDDQMKANFPEIQTKLFDKSCALAGCHVTNGIGPNLSAGNSYDAIVDKDAFGTNFKYVETGNGANSYIVKKMRGDNDIFGGVMPTSGKLPNSIIDSVAKWIDNGAPRN